MFWLTEEWASVAALRFSPFYTIEQKIKEPEISPYFWPILAILLQIYTFCCSCTKLKLICALRPFLGKVIGAMALIPKFKKIVTKIWEPWS